MANSEAIMTLEDQELNFGLKKTTYLNLTYDLFSGPWDAYKRSLESKILSIDKVCQKRN